MPHDVKLGQIIDDPAQQRDAIHVAVAPVVATAPPHPPDAPPLSPNQDQVQTHTLTLNTWDRGDENENEGVRRASTSNSNSEQQQQRVTEPTRT